MRETCKTIDTILSKILFFWSKISECIIVTPVFCIGLHLDQDFPNLEMAVSTKYMNLWNK